jgi:thiol-disulfide isomerase/thioredoxin
MKKIILLLFFLFAYGLTNSFSQSVSSWTIEELENSIEHSDSVLVINFWATFCKPCIEEIPDMLAVVEKYKKDGVKLLLVSLDLPEAYPAGIDSFALANEYTAPVIWLNETNADHFCPRIDETWSGSIPATLIYNRKNNYSFFLEQQLSRERFEEELKKAL